MRDLPNIVGGALVMWAWLFFGGKLGTALIVFCLPVLISEVNLLTYEGITGALVLLQLTFIVIYRMTHRKLFLLEHVRWPNEG